MNLYNQRWISKVWGRDLWAVTIGRCSFFSVPKKRVSLRWQAHEDFHKKQWREMWYIGFLLKYLYFHVKYGYWNNPLEVEAREYADQFSGEFDRYMEY